MQMLDGGRLAALDLARSLDLTEKAPLKIKRRNEYGKLTDLALKEVGLT